MQGKELGYIVPKNSAVLVAAAVYCAARSKLTRLEYKEGRISRCNFQVS